MDFLKKKFTNAKDKSKKGPNSPKEEVVVDEKPFEINLNNLRGYTSEQLMDFVQKYERSVATHKRKLAECNEELLAVKELAEVHDRDKRKLFEEKEQATQLLQDLQGHLDREIKEKYRLSEEIEAIKRNKKPENAALVDNKMIDWQKVENLNADIEKLLKTVHPFVKDRVETSENSPKGAHLHANNHLVGSPQYQEELLKVLGEAEVSFKRFCNKLEELTECINSRCFENLADLQENYAKLESKVADLEDERDAFRNQNNLLKIENSANSLSLNEQKAKIVFLEKMKVDLTDELEAVKRQLEPLKKECENQEANLQGTKSSFDELLKSELAFKNRVSELENRNLQERIRVEQKCKELEHVETQYRETRAHLAESVESYNAMIRKVEALESEAKHRHEEVKDLKRKLKHSGEEMHELRERMAQELREKTEELQELKKTAQPGQLDGVPADANNNANTANNGQKTASEIQKEQEITNLRREVAEQQERLDKVNAENESLAKAMEELTRTTAEQKKTIQILSEKRENALQEIKKLSAEVNQLRGGKTQGENLLIPPPQSARSEAKSYNTARPCTRTGNGTPAGKTSNYSNNTTTFPDFSFALMAGTWKNNTLETLQVLKKDLEGLYRDFIVLLPQCGISNDQGQIIKLEKRVNDGILKAQECIDNIEEFTLFT